MIEIRHLNSINTKISRRFYKDFLPLVHFCIIWLFKMQILFIYNIDLYHLYLLWVLSDFIHVADDKRLSLNIGLPKNIVEKAMAPHSSTLAWKTPWMEEPGRQQFTGLRRVGHDWVTSLSLFTSMHWRRKWQPTPVFLPGESQGQGSLVGCHLWGRTESDTTEAT